MEALAGTGGNGLQGVERNGRHEETRTPDLYRVKVALWQPAIDSNELNSRRSRSNRHKRRSLLQIATKLTAT